METAVGCSAQGDFRTRCSGGGSSKSCSPAVRCYGDGISCHLPCYQGKLLCRAVPGAVLRAEIQGIVGFTFVQMTIDRKAAVACGINAFFTIIVSIQYLTACICRTCDFILACSLVSIEYRCRKGQNRGSLIHAHQQEHTGHILALHAVYTEHQRTGKVGDGKGIRSVRCEGRIGIHACDRNTVGIRAGHGKRIAAAAHIGMVHAVFVRRTGCAVHSKGKAQRRVFRQIFTGGFGFCAVILCAVLRLCVGAYTDLVGLVCRQIFGFRRFLAAHGQCHINRGRALVKVIAKAGIDPAAALFLINRHAVAVGVIHLLPCGAHDFVAGEFQRHTGGGARLVGVVVGVSNRVGKLLAVDGGKDGHVFGTSVFRVDRGGLFRHQEGGYIVFARRHQRSLCGDADRIDLGGVYGSFVHKIGCLAGVAAQIGAQGVGRVLCGVLHPAGERIAALRQIQLFKRCNRKTLFIGKAQRARTDGIAAALFQAQNCHTVLPAVILRLFHVRHNGRIDVRIGINVAVVGDPMDGDGRAAIPCNRQGALNLRVGDAVVKRQHDVRRFTRGGSDRNICRTAAVCRQSCFQSHQHDRRFPAVFQRHALYQRINTF